MVLLPDKQMQKETTKAEFVRSPEIFAILILPVALLCQSKKIVK